MNSRALGTLLVLTLAAACCRGETGYVNVRVEDVHQQPVRLVEIGIARGTSKLTKDDGKAQLPLADDIKADDWISFQLVHSPPGKDLAIVSPWDNRIPVPSFAENSENLVHIIVVQRGDRAALESGTILASLTAKINKANLPHAANQRLQQGDPKEALLEMAKQYGLTPEDIDRAIRAWGATTTDTYEAGLVALYERNYAKASSALQDSLRLREEKLEADQRLVLQDQKNVADAAAFLGQSLYEQGRYSQSAEAYKKCLSYHANDPKILNNLGASLKASGDHEAAERSYRLALAIDERALGHDDPRVATDLNNLAELYDYEGKDEEAEPLYKRALAIDEKTLGPDHPDVSAVLSNLATLYHHRGRFEQAEPLHRRAIAIDEKIGGPYNPDLGPDLSNLGTLYQDQGKYDKAEPLFKRALSIAERALGPDHPKYAICLTNLAGLYDDQGKYNDSEPLYKRALAIEEKTLGPDHPDVATTLNDLGLVYCEQGKYHEAEPLYKRAIAIDEKAFGPDHPSIASTLNNLAALYYHLGKPQEAEPLYKRAIAIDEKVGGPDNPDLAPDLNNLAKLYEEQARFKEAESLYKRALAIDELTLGPDHPDTKTIRGNLASFLKRREETK